MSGTSLPLLQFIAAADRSGTIVAVSILGGLILFLVIGSVRGGSGSSKGGSGFSKGELRSMGRKVGLDGYQARLLVKTAKTVELPNPSKIFSSKGYLNRFVRRAVRDIDSKEIPEAQKEALKSEIFAIRQAIVFATSKKTLNASTKRLRTGLKVSIFSKVYPPQKSVLSANIADGVAFEVPIDSKGVALVYPKNAPLKMRFFSENGDVYAFTGKNLGVTDVNGVPNMLVSHSDKISHIQLRRSERRETNDRVIVYKIEAMPVTQGRGEPKVKMMVNKKAGTLGSLENLSSGGCAVRVRSNLKKGNFVRIDYDIRPGKTIVLYGKVLNVQRSGPGGSSLRIKFTKMSRSNLNEIEAFVAGIFDHDLVD